jgi:hypothetical protein
MQGWLRLGSAKEVSTRGERRCALLSEKQPGNKLRFQQQASSRRDTALTPRGTLFHGMQIKRQRHIYGIGIVAGQ